MAQQNLTPDREASLGLIFRLNNLWADIDDVSRKGFYLAWNNALDAIYRNLLYREEMVTKVDKNTGKITKVGFSEKDIKVYRFISLEIAKAIENSKFNRNPRLKKKLKSVWYHKVQKKDIWLRKMMYKNKLYLKETEATPGSTVYGTAKRRYR